MASTRQKEHSDSARVYLLSSYVIALVGNNSYTSDTLWCKSICIFNDLLKMKTAEVLLGTVLSQIQISLREIILCPEDFYRPYGTEIIKGRLLD